MLEILFNTTVGLLSVLTLVAIFVIMAVIYGYFYKKVKEESKQK